MAVNSKPYDAEVEWLGANGTQYVDIDFTPKIGDSIYAKVLFTDYAYTNDEFVILSAGDSSSNMLHFDYVRSVVNNARGLRFKYFTNTYSTVSVTPTNNTWYQLNINSSGTATLAGKTMTSTPIDELENNTTLRLFSNRNSTTVFRGRISEFYVVRNGERVLDLIPVRVGQIGYMYDKVSGQLFGNSGSGNFILGNDVN